MEAAATLGSSERLPVPFVHLFNQHIVGTPIMWQVQFEELRIQQGMKQTLCPQSFRSGFPGGGIAPPAQTPHSQTTPACTRTGFTGPVMLRRLGGSMECLCVLSKE